MEVHEALTKTKQKTTTKQNKQQTNKKPKGTDKAEIVTPSLTS